MKYNTLDWIAWVLVLIGGLNWGLVGFFNWDLVANVFGGGDAAATFPRVIYAIVGVAALYMLVMVGKWSKNGK